MSFNNILHNLHFERLNRLNIQKPEQMEQEQNKKSEEPVPEFCCAVCYTDGNTSGLVNPKCCSHKICLSCYTNIVIISKHNAKCPECRALYVPKAEAVQSENDDSEYDDMPPLISATDERIVEMANYTTNYINNIVINRINNLNDNNIRLINDFLSLIEENHGQIID
jgi:hypothetical protein